MIVRDLTFRLLDHLLAVDRPAANAQVRSAEGAALYVRLADWTKTILSRVAVYHLTGATLASSVVAELERDREHLPWPTVPPQELLDFLRGEARLRDGVLAFVPAGDDYELHWPHRSVAEALAAGDLVRRHREAGGKFSQEFDAGVRGNGQGFGLLVLAALDRTESGRLLVGLILKRYLDKGASEFRSTVFCMRALGAGIEIDDANVRARLVRTLVTLLLLPPQTRIGRITCQEVFSTEDLPDMLQIASRPHVRPLVAEQLYERWRRRHPSFRNQPGPLRVSAREAIFLDKLAMWWEVGDLHLVPPFPGPVTPTPSTLGGMNATAQSTGQLAHVRQAPPQQDALMATLALDVLIRSLREDSAGFLSGLAERARQTDLTVPAIAIVQGYVAELLAQTLHPPPPNERQAAPSSGAE